MLKSLVGKYRQMVCRWAIPETFHNLLYSNNITTYTVVIGLTLAIS